jgi:acetyl-CoA carboxylase biotin carboxylase subunit
LDLIKWQIQIASGMPLTLTQDDIPCVGASIECRINAEDPDRFFQPCPGKIESMQVPGGLGVRFDSHAHTGYTVPPYYDSMIGKLIVHKPTREEAIATMIRALDELRVQGIATTAPFHKKVLQHTDFVNGGIDTGFVERAFFSE